MRRALIISVAGHATVLLCGLVAFASPALFESAPVESITVDLVSPSEAAGSSQDQTPASQPPTGSAMTPASDSGGSGNTDRSASSHDSSGSGSADRSASSHDSSGSGSTDRSTSSQSTSPSSQVSPSVPTTQPNSPKANEFVFNLATVGGPISSLLDHEAENHGDGFDAPADSSAGLSSDEIAAFKAHLKKCWNPPAEVAGAGKTTVVLRVALSRDGALRAKPGLLEASASPRGLALVQTAMRALSDCQPYSFLGAEKYSEWKLLDLRFSPDGLSGG